MTQRSYIRQWVLRTVGHDGGHVNDIVNQFAVDYPEGDITQLRELLEAREDLIVDDQGRVTLSDEARHELDQFEHIGEHEWSRRARESG